MTTESPLYRHDCPNCVYLGRWTANPACDLYVCWQGGKPTSIYRYGDEGEAYGSWPMSPDTMLSQSSETKERAAIMLAEVWSGPDTAARTLAKAVLMASRDEELPVSVAMLADEVMGQFNGVMKSREG